MAAESSPSSQAESCDGGTQNPDIVRTHQAISLVAERRVNATINLVDASATPLPCEVETREGGYSLGFTPSVRGIYKLQLQVGDVDVEGSPFPLYVAPSPEARGQPVRVISGVRRPFGLAIDRQQGLLVVAEYGRNCLTVYNKDGEKVQTLGAPEESLVCPSGVAVTSKGHILVTDQHRLLELAPDGHCMRCVGSREPGSGALEFDHPHGLAIHPTTGQIYVADSNNHRIQVINDNFTYSHSFGSQGSEPGELGSPNHLAFDAKGDVYVANYSRHCIEVFNRDGQYLRQFGSKGSNGGQLAYPTGIAIDAHHMVYVTEYENNRISVFNTSGEFIRCIGCHGYEEGEYNGPYGVAMDTVGNLYISDAGNYRIVIL